MNKCVPPSREYLLNGVVRYPLGFSHSYIDVVFQSTPPSSNVTGLSISFFRSITDCANSSSVSNLVTFAVNKCLPNPAQSSSSLASGNQYYVKFAVTIYSIIFSNLYYTHNYLVLQLRAGWSFHFKCRILSKFKLFNSLSKFRGYFQTRIM